MVKISDVSAENYDGVKGELLLGDDGYYYTKLFLDGKEYVRKGYEKKAVKDFLLPDYAWMSLEHLYEDVCLGTEVYF